MKKAAWSTSRTLSFVFVVYASCESDAIFINHDTVFINPYREFFNARRDRSLVEDVGIIPASIRRLPGIQQMGSTGRKHRASGSTARRLLYRQTRAMQRASFDKPNQQVQPAYRG